ncbi:hypothetical protein SNE40_023241 [Patella caerulea]|uniref:DNA primase large subunit C-terminal domain-containing protein n=1 Tax=Patella caerulea TaxID=87958 RepID=A0AAN8GBW1_PATCE
MSFYLKPPCGTISLGKLNEFAWRRLDLLARIHATGGDRMKLLDIVNDLSIVSHSECLIGGTQKDNVSHYILRLILSREEETSKFLLETEKILFDFRSSCMTQDELYKLLRSLNKFKLSGVHKEHRVESVLSSLFLVKKLCNNSWKMVVKKYSECGDDEYFYVPFQTVLPLVAKRQVFLKDGMAMVPFLKLLDFLREIFSSLLTAGIKKAGCQSNTDVRIEILSRQIMKRFKNQVHGFSSSLNYKMTLLHNEVDNSVKSFPPCMIHLHSVLRERHRLSHHARIQYSLFLKEMGLPVHEAIVFWRSEYSKSAPPGVDWGHNWKAEGERYIYNIRHLYGLEGSRKNYRGHCCHSIQNQTVQPTSVGGCPFVHFDKTNLQNFLSTQQIDSKISAAIMEYKEKSMFNDACSLFLKGKNPEFYRDNHSDIPYDYCKKGSCSLNNTKSECTKCSLDESSTNEISSQSTVNQSNIECMLNKSGTNCTTNECSTQGTLNECSTKYTFNECSTKYTCNECSKKCTLNECSTLNDTRTKCIASSVCVNNMSYTKCVSYNTNSRLVLNDNSSNKCTLSTFTQNDRESLKDFNLHKLKDSTEDRPPVYSTTEELLAKCNGQYQRGESPKSHHNKILHFSSSDSLTGENHPDSTGNIDLNESHLIGCNHEIFPSQNTNNMYKDLPLIEKPVDYCISYKLMIQKLQTYSHKYS